MNGLINELDLMQCSIWEDSYWKKSCNVYDKKINYNILYNCIIINCLKRDHSKIKFFILFFICQNPDCFCWGSADGV